MAEDWWSSDVVDEALDQEIDDFWSADNPDGPPATEAEPAPEELDAISTRMYSGMTFNDAMARYKELLASPDITPPPLGIGYAMYRDPETGRSEYVPQPSPRMFGKDGLLANTTSAGVKLIQGDLKGASEAFMTPLQLSAPSIR